MSQAGRVLYTNYVLLYRGIAPATSSNRREPPASAAHRDAGAGMHVTCMPLQLF